LLESKSSGHAPTQTVAPGRTVLIADDDQGLRNLLTRTLELGRFTVVTAADGLTALQTAREIKPDLYLLDVDMPGMSGIVMLTGMDSEAAMVAGLEAGADDYQTKPFAGRELLARVKAHLRRRHVYVRDPDPAVFVTGDLRVDFDQHLAYKAGRAVNLTPTEFRILAFLARAPGQIRTSRAILSEVWGATYGNEVHVLRVNVARLRHKIEDDASAPRYVLTHPRAGYSLNGQPA
jgi:DNA-binding response OmpR family regulator